ncbi:hypothetical protein WJ0W_006682 [Paenibacillus melissococcoides]|uniref:Uncharacterized protein n=1 Tax=Paenibacillus melissococcoides TaxID=2912268 RepID=A0ABM9GBJ1_9BACL|nr:MULTISPECIES: hypothetical protein [Paenibacillus]MEB9895707.1 hypothetical protein [Bacillus cereus]GIO81548.1 hypothetical protein J6TS7_51580 [Paenibacillus dendritiformis]CAH8249497.1 hypothetical protein WJ0W_006682 [Paenibacillus melissococcoides]CAH8721193.1 hypothetical protein HTL2_006236 [Paenibacillus melissococcoides]
MKTTMSYCVDCMEPVWYGSAETGSEKSQCICEDKRVKCDNCGHSFLKKDLSINNLFIAVCRCCYEPFPYLMDNMAVGYFVPSMERAHTMMCVEKFDDKLQLTIRSYHLGISVLFPAMTKAELICRWMQGVISLNSTDIELMFNAAVLRLVPDYLSRNELITVSSNVKRSH